jgi:cholesterol transport system auxiliary component
MKLELNVEGAAKASQTAIKSGAKDARINWAKAAFYSIFGAFLLAGCSALPDKPTRPTLYDFGPGPLEARTPAAGTATALPPLAIADVATAGGAIDNQAVLYRLGYTDAQELRPYSLARWSMPPSQLVRQRLREQLGQRRPIFNARESLALNRGQSAALPLQLRLDLEEFTHFFQTPAESVGLIRLRATLVEVTPAGERLVGQRNLVVQRPAATADAPGGVRALAAATDAAIDDIDQWLQQTPAR